VWCTPTGKCVAGGTYIGNAGQAGFADDEQNGSWGQVQTVRFEVSRRAGRCS